MDRPIKIYFAPGCNKAADCIALSAGTRVADVRETTDLPDSHRYEEGAMLPREPWRPPTRQEAESLILTETPRDTATSVAIVKLPGEFSHDQREAIRSGIEEQIETNLLRPLRAICRLGEPVHYIGPNRNPANLKTVTFNDRSGRYNGLHVDSWDQRDVNALHLACNRVCVNIGESDRYLLFLPFSLMDIAGMLAEEIGPGWQMPKRHTVIGRTFMARFPEIPVIRCRLAPGEAYVAPTENLVHDGSSAGQSAPDEQFTVRGHIGLL
jgi:hypothetical protein